MIAEGELAVLGSGEEADGVLVELGDLFGWGVFSDAGLPDVKTSALLGEVEKLLVVEPDRVAVFAGEVGDLTMGFFPAIEEPDVAGD